MSTAMEPNSVLPAADDVQRVVTVRLSKEKHIALMQEAQALETSMNRLAIAKLEQPLPPEAAAKIRGVKGIVPHKPQLPMENNP